MERLDEAGADGPRALETRRPARCSSGGCAPRSRPSRRRSPCASSTPAPSSCPSRPSEALYSAAVQAMVNSLQHAGARPRHGPRAARPRRRDRRLRHRGRPTTASASIATTCPTSGSALRVSIVERMANAGGAAEIVSRPAQGTTVADRVAGRHAREAMRRDRRPPLAPRRARGAVLRATTSSSASTRSTCRVPPWPTGGRAMVLYAIATVAEPVAGASACACPIWLAAFDLAVAHRAAAARHEPARSRRRQRLRDLVRRRGGHPDDDHGGAAAAGRRRGSASSRSPCRRVVWAGPLSLGALGVIGSIVWVAIAHMLTTALTKAARETRRFAHAEREATDWQAAQDAHLYERQLRLAPDEPHRRADAAAHRRPRRRPHRRPDAGVPHARGGHPRRDPGPDAAQRRRARGGAARPRARVRGDAARRGRHRRPRRADQGPGARRASPRRSRPRAPTGSSRARPRRAGPSR